VVHDNATPLGSGESYTASAEVTLPAGVEGPFYVYVFTDVEPYRGLPDTEDERGDNERSRSEHYAGNVWEPPGLANNAGQTDTTIVYREADLVISDLVLTPATADSGSSVTASFTVTNQGTRQTREWSWNDRVYLSRDAALDSGDLLLGEFGRYGYLDPDASYDRSLDFMLPEGVDGDYFVLVYTDSDVSGQVVGGGVSDLSRVPPLRVGGDSVKEYRGEGNNITPLRHCTVDGGAAAPTCSVTACERAERVHHRWQRLRPSPYRVEQPR
jgi:hypothetical protein